LGAAFGLGNLWRFPYVVLENGGGAFVFLFFIMLFVIGLPLMVAELTVGKTARNSSLRAFRSVKDSTLARILGPLPPLVTVLVLSYYAVVSGWVLYFFFSFMTKSMINHQADWAVTLDYLHDTGTLQVGLAFAHLLLVTVIVGRGVEMGIERAVGLFMPILIGLVIFLSVRSMAVNQAATALKVFLYPDFSRLQLSSFSRVVGQVLFTLSLGFGTMVTFGSYLRERAFIPLVAFRVVVLDAVLSLFAGVLIFPLIGAASIGRNGPELLFKTVPVWLGSFSGGRIFGVLFFLCLYLAALGSSIALEETVVANLQEFRPMSRAQAAFISGGFCFVLSLIPALSSNWFQSVSIHGQSLFEIVDSVLIEFGLPAIALMFCLLVGSQLKLSRFGQELLESDDVQSRRLFIHWRWLIRWVVPFVLSAALLSRAVDILFINRL
jgi:NSS family neurotransmitter:Na+ symporter